MRVAILTACTLSAFLAWELGRQVHSDPETVLSPLKADADESETIASGSQSRVQQSNTMAALLPSPGPISKSEQFAAEVLRGGRANSSSSLESGSALSGAQMSAYLPTRSAAGKPLPIPSEPTASGASTPPLPISAANLPIDRIVARSLALSSSEINTPPALSAGTWVPQNPFQSSSTVTPSPTVTPPDPSLPELAAAIPEIQSPHAARLPGLTPRVKQKLQISDNSAPSLLAGNLSSAIAAPESSQVQSLVLPAQTKQKSQPTAARPTSSPTEPNTAQSPDLLDLLDTAEQDIIGSLTDHVTTQLVSPSRLSTPSPVGTLAGSVGSLEVFAPEGAIVFAQSKTTHSASPTAATSTPASSPTVLPASAPAIDATYTLGAGDRVKLDVFNVPEYSGEHQVLVDGSLSLPLVGNVQVAGMTIDQASQVVSQRYAPLLRRPIVTISLLQPRPLQVAVAGEVNRPGSYTLSIANNAQFPSVVQALQSAGGITQAANLGEVQVQRPRLSGPPQLITLNLWDLVRSGNIQQDIPLRDGDSIFVPTAANPTIAENNQLATASFASDIQEPIEIAVVGEVYRPGSYKLEVNQRDETTVTQAIQVAGGIKSYADIRHIEVRRPTRMGDPQVFNVDLWALLQDGDLQQDMVLQEGDTVVVPTATALSPEEVTQLAAASFSPDTIQVNVVGEVEKPGAIEISPNSPLTQALLAAGGFNERARRGSVELVRLNPDGTMTRRSIDIDLGASLDEENNPALRNNDIVIVGRSGAASLSDSLGILGEAVNSVLRMILPFNLF